MSNLTPQDVDVRLTATRNELVEEDLRLLEGLEDEKISRIAGDEANKQFTMQVQGENASTESRLSTEVIHRSEGDLTNITSLNTLAVALSEYRIKTDLEITNEKIARQQLGVDLNTRVDNFVASWDHDKFLIYQSIQTVQLDVNNKYASMDLRIKKYEDMLQDITMDSIQITMDSGEINMGAWTILSQAREWDLQTIGRMKDFQVNTQQDLNQALEDIQNKLPVEQNIIDKAIEALSNAPVIKALDDKLTSNIADIGAFNQDLLNEITARQNEMVAQAQNTADELKKQADALAATISAESSARIDALQREAQIRQEQLLLESQERTAEIDQRISELDLDTDADLEAINKRIDDVNTKADDINVVLGEQKVELNQSIGVISAKADAIKAESDQKILNLNTKADGIHDEVSAETAARIAAVTALNGGLTSEIQHRKDGDQVVTTALENYKSSNDKALANVRTEIAANVTATTANATKIDALDVRLTTNEEETGEAKALAASATQKAETALTETSALVSQMTTVNASIDGIKGDLAKKADAAAFNQLKAEVVEIDGKVLTNTQDLTALKTTVTGLDGKVTGNTSAISKLTTQQVVQGDQITQLTSDTTALKNSLEGVEDDLATKVDSTAFNELSTKVDKNASDITVQAGSITKLQSDLVLTNQAVNTKANASALTTLDTKVSTINGKVTSNASAITNLSNRVGVTEGAISKKADAAALSSLDTKVTAIDGKVTTQGTSITKLQNDLATTNQNVATKADATALSALSNTVTEQGGKITANSTAITDLNNKVSIVENDVAKKADAAAVSSLSTKVGTLEGTVASQGTAVTKLQNDLALTNTAVSKKAESSALNALDSKVTQQGNTITSQGGAITKLQNDVSSMDTKLDTKASSAALSALDTKVTKQGTDITSQGSSITKLQSDLTQTNTNVSNKADSSALTALDNKVTSVDGKVTTNASNITTLQGKVTTVENGLATKAEGSALSALTTRVTNAEGVNTSQGTAITTLQNTVNHATTGLATKASSTALTTVDNKVTGQGNTLTSQGIAITKLTTDLSTLDTKVNTKANSTVVSSLGSKVTSIEGIVTSQGTSLTSLTNRVELAEGNINKKADSSAVTALESKVTQQGLDITSQGASITRIDAAIDATNLAVATKASAAALSTLDSKVTSIDGKVSSNTSAITALTGRVTATEGALTTKASVDAVNSLTTRITTAEGTIASQATSITSLNSGLVTTNTNVTAAQTAANKANTLAGGKGKVFFQNAEPAVADRLVQNLWIDTTGNNNTPKRWLTNAWVAVNDKIATDALTAANAANVAIATKADASALSLLDSKVTSINGTVTSQGVSITNLNTRLSSAEGALTTKADSSAVSALDTKVTQQGNTITSQGTDITKLKADLALTNTAVSTKASSEALQSLDNRVVSIDGKVTTNASSITALKGKMTTVENGLATKADGSALTALTNRVTSAEGVNTTQSSNITTLTNNLTTTNKNVATKADTSAVTALTTRVTNAEGVNTSQGSSITSLTNNLAIANTAINTKASSAAVTTLDTKVTAIDGKVSANTNDLTVLKGTVDNNQSYIINNYYTKTDANTATANHITQFKSTLYVGARNLLINSDFRKGLQGWGTYDATVTINNAATIDNKPSSYAYIRGGVGGIYKTQGNIPHVFTTTEDVTFSLMVRGNGRLRLGFDASFKDFTISNTVNWTRITHTQKGVPNSNMVCSLISGTYIDVAYLKVELGSIPTEWSPAPEDDIRDIETTATAVNSISTQVTEIDEKVTASASQILTLESFKNGINNGSIPGHKELVIDLRTGYNQDTYFPVAVSSISVANRTRLRVYSTLDGKSKPAWSTHGSGYSLTLDWETTGIGWGIINAEQVINNSEWLHTFNGISPALGPTQMGNSSEPVVYLRGGGYYVISLPEPNTIRICPPNGSIAGIGGQTVSPTAYNAGMQPVSISKDATVTKVRLQQTNEVVDGVKAVSTVSVDNNGFLSGYGLISQLVNGVVQSAFGVNADYFYVGTANSNKKKPFMVLTSPQNIGGVTYPAGTWMDVALIANATIGTAHIQDASITNAKIKDLNADKITAGTLDANRIGANSITAEKLVIGDTTNLWGNQYFETNVRPNQARTAWYPYTKELKGRGVQMWGRDHMAPYSTRIPLKAGDEFVIEFTAGLNTGAFKALGVGLWVYDATGSQGTDAFQFGVPEQIATLGNGWYRYRRVFTVADNGSGLPAAYGTLYFQIPQSDTEANPTYWTAGDVVVRKRMGGELIVNGAITAEKLYSNTVSGMFANFGEFRSTGADGSVSVMNSKGLTIIYPNGKTAIKIGIT